MAVRFDGDETDIFVMDFYREAEKETSNVCSDTTVIMSRRGF